MMHEIPSKLQPMSMIHEVEGTIYTYSFVVRFDVHSCSWCDLKLSSFIFIVYMYISMGYMVGLLEVKS